MNRPALGVRARRDLRFVQTFHARESAIVAKDPISLKYHRMRPDEYFVLRNLEAVQSLGELKEKYEKRYQPQRVTEPQLNQLLFRFHQSGLLVSDTQSQGERLYIRRGDERRKRWQQQLSGLLFIRFPGVDPEPFLKRLYPIVRPCLSWLGMLAAALVTVVALILFLIHWERFTIEFPQMDHWLRLDSVLQLAVVIGSTKVLHELGHAIACKHFGGECHQIGPMLLVFTPALYCDTSDSWMLPSRFQRAAVGLAGIGVEVMLAAIATVVWSVTASGAVHYLAMNVMLVCGISTVLFNANPLLRYDGYYVLSDLCDVPNLGEKSRKALASVFAKQLFGVPDDSHDDVPLLSRIGLLAYAIAAFVYRWLLTLVILWFVSIALRPYGLESIGRLFCVGAAAGMIYALVQKPIQFLKNPSRRHQIKMKRTLLTLVVTGAILAACAIPFPSHVTGTARVLPHAEVRVYVKTAGDLDDLRVRPGDFIQSGGTIARLSNPDVVMEATVAANRRDVQAEVVASLRSARGKTADASNQLPSAESLLVQLTEQAERSIERRDALTITSPVSGTVIASPKRSPLKDRVVPLQQAQLVNWTGAPTSVENEGCHLKAGTELVSLAVDGRWDAEIILDQSQIRRIWIGAPMKLFLESAPGVTVQGRVIEIARSQWSAEKNAERRDDPDAVNRLQPVQTSYLVRVQLDAAPIRLVTGATALAKLRAEEASVIQRIIRTANSLFRFRS